MHDYHGIVIKQSLLDQNDLSYLNVISVRNVSVWDFLLVGVSEEGFWNTINSLQQRMINIETDCWYNPFFKGDQLIVVYQNKLFQVTTHPDSWEQAIRYGLNHGIPREQLDFDPRTKEFAALFFGANLHFKGGESKE